LAEAVVELMAALVAALAAAEVVMDLVLVVLGLLGRATTAAMEARVMGVAVAEVLVKPDLMERHTAQLVAETVFRHQ
jgi:succinate dehydrogenase/fumarate reductase flavoprotein subunit